MICIQAHHPTCFLHLAQSRQARFRLHAVRAAQMNRCGRRATAWQNWRGWVWWPACSAGTGVARHHRSRTSARPGHIRRTSAGVQDAARARSTAYGLRTPAVFAPVKAASARQPARLQRGPHAGASLARWAAVSRQPSPRAAKNSSAGPPPCAVVAVADARARARGRRTVPWMVPWAVRVQSPHPVAAPVAPRRGAGCAAIRRNQGQIQRPGDRLDARRAPPGRHAISPSAVQPLGSVLVSFTPVRSCSPAHANQLSAQVRYTRDRWRMGLRSPRKRVRGQPLRGFKSHLHRHWSSRTPVLTAVGGRVVPPLVSFGGPHGPRLADVWLNFKFNRLTF